MKNPTSVVERAPVEPRVEQGVAKTSRTGPRVAERHPAGDAPAEHESARWLLILLLVLVGTFVASMAKFVLSPAVASLTATTDSAWTAEGP